MATRHKGDRFSIIDFVNAVLDRATWAISVVEYEHHEIHAGSHFYVADFETIAADGTVVFAITTPDTAKWLHMTFEISGTSRTELYIGEDATITGGDAVTPLNNNRNSANTTVATIVKDPTVNDDGTEIFNQSSGIEGTTPSRANVDAQHDRNREIILKQNSTTVFIITSRDDDNIVNYVGEWYEHTDKETV